MGFQLDQGSLNKLQGIHPDLIKVMKLAAQIYSGPGKFIIIDGRRTQAQQDHLYAQGRTRPGPIVSSKRNSRHVYGCAIDFNPVDAEGKRRWKNGEEAYFTPFHKLFKQAAQLAGVPIRLGITFGDPPHVELPTFKYPDGCYPLSSQVDPNTVSAPPVGAGNTDMGPPANAPAPQGGLSGLLQQGVTAIAGKPISQKPVAEPKDHEFISGSLNKNLILRIWECNREGQPVGGMRVNMFAIEGENEIASQYTTPFEAAGAESKMPNLMGMIQSGEAVAAVGQLAGNAAGVGMDGLASGMNSLKSALEGLEGKTSLTKVNSVNIFVSTQPIRFTFTVLLRAWQDPGSEVEAPLNTLQAWVLPQHLSDQGVLASVTGGNGMFPSVAPPHIAISYGGKTFAPLFLESVTNPLVVERDSNGNRLAVQFQITLTSRAAMDANDWRRTHGFAEQQVKFDEAARPATAENQVVRQSAPAGMQGSTSAAATRSAGQPSQRAAPTVTQPTLPAGSPSVLQIAKDHIGLLIPGLGPIAAIRKIGDMLFK